MAVKYVSPSGSDATGVGSESNRWKTLVHALISITSGDTIVVGPGSYSEVHVGGAYSKNVTLVGETNSFEDVEVTIIQIGDVGSSAAKAWLGGTANNTILVKNMSFIFDYSKILSGWNSGYYYTNSIFWNYGSSAYINCIGNLFIGKNLPDGAGTSQGIPCGIRPSNAGKALLYKNTFRGFTNSGVACAVCASYSSANAHVTAKDNIFEGNLVGINVTAADKLVEDYNCFYNNYRNATYGGTPVGTALSLGANSIAINPKLIADGGALAPDSPCRDAGVVVADYVEDYFGLAPDIGCYELRPSFPVAKIAGIDGANVAEVSSVPAANIAKVMSI